MEFIGYLFGEGLFVLDGSVGCVVVYCEVVVCYNDGVVVDFVLFIDKV